MLTLFSASPDKCRNTYSKKVNECLDVLVDSAWDTLKIDEGVVSPDSFSRLTFSERDAAAWSEKSLQMGEVNVFWRGFPDVDGWGFFPQTIEGSLYGRKYRIDLYSRVQIILPERCYIFFSREYKRSKSVKLYIDRPKNVSVDKFINSLFSNLLDKSHSIPLDISRPMTPAIEQEAVSFLIKLIAAML